MAAAVADASGEDGGVGRGVTVGCGVSVGVGVRDGFAVGSAVGRAITMTASLPSGSVPTTTASVPTGEREIDLGRMVMATGFESPSATGAHPGLFSTGQTSSTSVTL